jgi:class 3 adenylate cyclase
MRARRAWTPPGVAQKEIEMGNSWKHDRAKAKIDTRYKEVETVNIVDYTRDTSLESIPANKAYRMDAVHLYADILNLSDMLNSSDVEGETCHKRTLRFLNLHYRAAHRVLVECDAIRVDFHNQRLHAVIAKPYGSEDEGERIDRAVAIGQLLIDVLSETGDDDEQIPNAKVRVGIDTGMALAVNNGRRGNREPLFLGKPANLAAKLASNRKRAGIYLSNEAREAIGLDAVEDEYAAAMTRDQIDDCEKNAALSVTKDKIVREWRDDNKAHPIGAFQFSRHTPPLSTLDIASLTPGNSRRMEAVSVYADLDGFTAYVDDHIDDDAEDVVRCLHVIRAELDRVISSDFSGRRIRFIGDCVHGLLLEGTAHTTDIEQTISTAVLCAGGLRSSFDLALERLAENGVDTTGLGLAVGFEYGPMTITRLGMQGDRVRCSVSRGVLASEAEQKRCLGTETAIGPEGYKSGTEAVRKIFGSKRKSAALTYDLALESLAADQDKTAKAVMKEAYAVTSPALARSVEQSIRPHSKRL